MHGKVLLATHPSAPTALRAVKVLKRHGVPHYAREETERELRALQRMVSTSGPSGPVSRGADFVHTMHCSFSDNAFTFLVLVHILRAMSNLIGADTLDELNDL